MYIRLLVLSLLVALCVTTLAAQSATDKKSATPQPVSVQAQPTPSESTREPMAAITQAGDDESNPTPRRWLRRLNSPVLAENDSTCYFIRSYRVTRDDPESDATRPAGYSTCLAASRLQMKSAVDSREIVPQ